MPDPAGAAPGRACSRAGAGPRRGRVGLARPPEAVTEHDGDGRHEQGAHDERVEQDADADDDADLGEHDERQHAEHGKDRREQDAGARDDASRRCEPAEHALSRSVAAGLLACSRDEEDVVVDAERHEEDEGEERRAVVESREAEHLREDPPRGADAREVGRHDGRHEHERSHDRAQQHERASSTSVSTSGKMTSRSRVEASAWSRATASVPATWLSGTGTSAARRETTVSAASSEPGAASMTALTSATPLPSLTSLAPAMPSTPSRQR